MKKYMIIFEKTELDSIEVLAKNQKEAKKKAEKKLKQDYDDYQIISFEKIKI